VVPCIIVAHPLKPMSRKRSNSALGSLIADTSIVD
jgi:hypothetical protein